MGRAVTTKRRRRSSAGIIDPGGPIDVTVILLEGGFASTAIGPIEVFHSAGQLWNWLKGEPPQPRFRVRVASPGGRMVRSVCDVGLKPQCALEDIDHTDIAMISASGWDLQEKIMRHTSIISWLRKMHAQGAYLGAVCSGAAYVAETGLMDGREATTHWGVADMLRERYPNVRWRPEQFVTEDGRICCSGGVYASIDISLYLVEKFCGHEVALQCAKSLLVGLPRSCQSGYSVLPLSRPHSDKRIGKAEEHLRSHFREEVGIEALARRCAMSPRTFIRRFKGATGRLPGEYLQMMRITAAREMLEGESTSIQDVSERVGYSDLNFFRSLFKRHTGMTPAEYRARFSSVHYSRGELATGSVD
ncbi:MAG TPA: helix-turn-helix domain-containing protein [Burkholderiaceae bacterium]|nr:helix-turn-helix domain-containing protein [Burkholderiaceae bacterium]